MVGAPVNRRTANLLLAVGACLAVVVLPVGYLRVPMGRLSFFAAKQGRPRPGGNRTTADPHDGAPSANEARTGEHPLPRPGGSPEGNHELQEHPGGNRTTADPHDGAPSANETRTWKYNLLQIGGPWADIRKLLQMLLTDLPGDLLPQDGDCDVFFFTGWIFSKLVLKILNRARPPRPRRNPEVVFVVNQESPENEWVWRQMPRALVSHALILGNWWNSTHEEYSDENVTSLWLPFGSLSFASRALSTPMDLSGGANTSWRGALRACSRNHLSDGRGGPPMAAAYLQRSCVTNHASYAKGKPWGGYREKFWDELNRNMLKELNTSGTALGVCNGHASLGARAGTGTTPGRGAQGGLPKKCLGEGTKYDESMALYVPFKVAVTLENTVSDVGYITEKIVNALLAGSIPVYAGSKHVSKVFNPKSYFFLEPGKNDAQAIASMIETLRNDSLYTGMLRQAVLSGDAMRRFFSWHPAVWPTHGDSLRRRIVGELRRHCRGHSPDVRLL